MKAGTRFKKLEPEQKKALLTWLTQDMPAYEIRERAAYFHPPFKVTQQQIHYYRGDRGMNLEELEAKLVAEARAAGFLINGLAHLARPKT